MFWLGLTMHGAIHFNLLKSNDKFLNLFLIIINLLLNYRINSRVV